MKKILSFVLILACAFMLFSCGDDRDTLGEISEMYGAIAPSKVVINSSESFGDYKIEFKSTLMVGKVDGVDAAVYEYTEQKLRTVADGAGVDIVGPIETKTEKWEYSEDLGRRDNGGKWDINGLDFTPETGAIALNLTYDTVKDLTEDLEARTVSFTVESANTEAVFGEAIPADVAVVISHSGADITGVTLSYTYSNPDNEDHPAVTVLIEASYSYETQVFSFD